MRTSPLLRRRAARWAWVIAAAGLFGCDRGGAPSPAGSAASPAKAAPAAGVNVAEDRSLDTSAYVEKGVPAPDRDWSPADYTRAAEALKPLVKSDAAQLPRAASPRSGAMFARMSSAQNLALLGNTSLPILARTQLGVQFMEAVNQLFVIYLEQTASGPSFDAELVGMTGLLLRLTVKILDLAAELRGSFPADDPKKDEREAGFEQMRQGAASVFGGALESLSERTTYRASVLLELVAALRETLPKALPSLPPLTQREIPVRVAGLAAGEKDPALKAALSDLSAALPPAGGAQ